MDNKLKLGQMFLVGFTACHIDDRHWLIHSIQHDSLGGVVLFDKNIKGFRQNITSPQQLLSLLQDISQYADIPLFFSIDQEGGKVCRLKEGDGFPYTFSAAELGRQDPEATTLQADAIAQTLAGCGINLNFAPVVDLNLQPDNPVIGRFQRSFGNTAAQVVAHAIAWIKAHHRHGVACCLKHFPGHGSSGQDSHLGFVDITESWQNAELEPYRALIDQGYADAIMTGHLVHRKLDPEAMPATLSPAMINGLLRRELGFCGPVFSDDLQMRAITQGWSYQEAVQKAVLAGVDVLVVGNNLAPQDDVVSQGIEAIQDLLDQGRISEERILASLARISALKKDRLGLSW